MEIGLSEEELSELLFDRRKEFNWEIDEIKVRIFKE
tara:strand:- start:107 stop:214 length:108 start_codon:yes stop_codon:yes gene_type:complete